MPIYFVVMEQKRIPGMWVPVWDILKVIECDLEDVQTQRFYDREVGPLQASGRIVQAMYFSREPANPFKDFKEGN